MIPWTNWATPVENDIWRMNFVLNDNYGTDDENTLWSGSLINSPDDAGEIIFSSQVMGSTCSSADFDSSRNVSMTELMSYITDWKAGSVTLVELMTAIGEWKNGC